MSFGSRYVVPPLEGQVYDYLPEGMLGRVHNVNSFAGILALDKWTCNADGRQVAFWRRPRERKFTATFIESGKRASLLALSPLRTGRESFPSSGSSRV